MMLRATLSRSFRSAAFRRVSGLRAISSSSQVLNATASNSKKIYELRTYSIQPSRFAEFLKLSEEHIHMRTEFSKLIGYWTTELGGLNETVHMWEYDNFAHRSAVRKALSQDKVWIEKYFSKILPMLVQQQNVLLYAYPWCQLKLEPGQKHGVYELIIHSVKPGMLTQLEHRMLQGLPARLEMNYPQPLGFWYSEFGPLSTNYSIWPHESLDKRAEHRKGELFDSEEWKETYRDTTKFFDSMYCKALVPTSFSSLQ